jgi:hypothetical protein
MDELSKSLHFIIFNEMNKILDKISVDFNINRHDLNKYTENEHDDKNQIQDEIINNIQYETIVLPVISDDDTFELANNGSELNTNTSCNSANSNKAEAVNIKCKQVTRKGKQCDYNAKPNSEYCGRHSK